MFSLGIISRYYNGGKRVGLNTNKAKLDTSKKRRKNIHKGKEERMYIKENK